MLGNRKLIEGTDFCIIIVLLFSGHAGMGCGVSKEEIVEPARIQSVVVGLGSPESHLKAHEALQHQQQQQHQQQNYGLISLANVELQEHLNAAKELRTSCCSPLSNETTATTGADIVTVSTTAGTQSAPPPSEVSSAQEISAGEREYCQSFSSSVVCLSYPSRRGPVDEALLQQQCKTKDSPVQQDGNGHDHDSPEAPALTVKTSCNDFMRGSLECLKEILDESEATSLRLAIQTTAKKIMNYGGVLHSLEDQVGSLSAATPYSASNEEEGTEFMTAGADCEDKLTSAKQSHGKLRSPRSPPVRSPRPELEHSRKKLPPILTHCISNVGDKSAAPDPFAKAPLSPLHQSKPSIPSSPPEDKTQATETATTTSTTELSRNSSNHSATASSSSSSPSPSSPSSCSSPDLEHSIRNIKDIVVLDSHPSSTNFCNHNHDQNEGKKNSNGGSNPTTVDDSDKLSGSPFVHSRWAQLEKVNSDEPEVENISLDDHEHLIQEKVQIRPQDFLLLDESTYDNDDTDSNSNVRHQSPCCHEDHAHSNAADDAEELQQLSNFKYDLKGLGRGDIQSPLLASLGASSHRNTYQDDGMQPLSSSEFYS